MWVAGWIEELGCLRGLHIRRLSMDSGARRYSSESRIHNAVNEISCRWRDVNGERPEIERGRRRTAWREDLSPKRCWLRRVFAAAWSSRDLHGRSKMVFAMVGLRLKPWKSHNACRSRRSFAVEVEWFSWSWRSHDRCHSRKMAVVITECSSQERSSRSSVGEESSNVNKANCAPPVSSLLAVRLPPRLTDYRYCQRSWINTLWVRG
jgi:hypothetical protein